jgi:2-polyprenyl-6-methoxyphenol hydroxylase-like FAD-dependent oxidoreductase
MDVLIVGAGPTGLTLACDLARQGVDFRIVAREPRPAPGSRGFSLKPLSLAALDDLGVAPAITAAGSVEHRTRFHLGTRLLFRGDVPPAAATAERPYPNLIALAQWRTEAILRDRLAELGRAVEFGAEVTGVDGENVTLAGGETMTARFVVGADGGHSVVRTAMGVEFAGHSGEQSAVVADVRLDGLDPAEGVHLWLDPGAGMLAARPQGAGLWQIVVSGIEPEPDVLRAAFRTRSGRPGVRITDVEWISRWRYNVRMASRFRVRNLFLAGDAAHVHSPFGGHGMNTGIQDAYNLGWKLGMVLRGEAPDALLDTYELERMPVARGILADSDRRMSAMLTSRLARPLLGPLMKAGMARQSRANRTDHPVYPAGPLIADGGGRPAPDGRLPTGARLFDLFRGPHFTVLGPGRIPGLDLSFVHVHPAPAAREYRVVRPDGYVALVTASPDRVLDYFARLADREPATV